jgi:undecaprenyl diphosphate synthase
MDGNGRWACARGLPRAAGHRRGADAVRRAVRAAPALKITILTLYAFSSDNWRRPPGEVAALLCLFRDYLQSERSRLRQSGVRLSVMGRRDRLTVDLIEAIEACEADTAEGTVLHLRVAIDYSGRDAILRAAESLPLGFEPTRDTFRERLALTCGAGAAADVDLLIRTGGERRLSDFLLWESAYAELCFLPCPWPDFRASDLAAAVAEFRTRQRRFGALAPERSALEMA